MHKYSIGIVRPEFGVEKREDIFKGYGPPAETVSGRDTTTPARFILYASVAACVFGEKRRPERLVGIDDIIRYGTHNIVVVTIGGQEPVINQK